MNCFRMPAWLLTAVFLLLLSCTKEDSTVYNTINFEDVTVPAAGFWNGSDGSGSFTSGGLKFTNSWNASWMTWSGFAFSQKCDVTTKGYDNQFSVFDAANGNNKFGLYYPPYGAQTMLAFNGSETHLIKSIDVCNDSYSALSMKYGDAFSKKFGGSGGSEADWFKVTVTGYAANGTKTGSVDIYLADFRFSDNSKDFILNKWTTFDLSQLGLVNKISMEFFSSDSGQFGVNTPTYVCLDNIRYAL